jgi:hypothetical protein
MSNYETIIPGVQGFYNWLIVQLSRSSVFIPLLHLKQREYEYPSLLVTEASTVGGMVLETVKSSVDVKGSPSQSLAWWNEQELIG